MLRLERRQLRCYTSHRRRRYTSRRGDRGGNLMRKLAGCNVRCYARRRRRRCTSRRRACQIGLVLGRAGLTRRCYTSHRWWCYTSHHLRSYTSRLPGVLRSPGDRRDTGLEHRPVRAVARCYTSHRVQCYTSHCRWSYTSLWDEARGRVNAPDAGGRLATTIS